VIVRSDAPTGIQAAMILHAAGESAQLPDAGAAHPPTRAVALCAPPAELAALARALADADVPHVAVHEPDAPWRGALMAIGLAPMPRARVRSLVAHLPLVRGKDSHV
jgi:hypothetical protein